MCPRVSELLMVDGACGIRLGPQTRPRQIETAPSRAMPRSQQPHGARLEETANETRAYQHTACRRGSDLPRLFGIWPVKAYGAREANPDDRLSTRRTLQEV